jgi:chromosome segregation ATPase
MRKIFPLLSVVALLALNAGCATSVDMDSVNHRIDDNATRLATLENTQGKQDQETTSQKDEKLGAFQAELDALRKDFADSKWAVDDMAEKVESVTAYMEEIEQFMVQFRKKGGEMDKALEEMTNRIEADVRSLAEKLKKMLEEESR